MAAVLDTWIPRTQELSDLAMPIVIYEDWATQAFNAVISRMVTAVLWTSPLGIASLIAAAICRACSLLGTLGALGAWLATVLSGLAIFGALILPAAFWALSRKGPLSVLNGFSRALVLAFGTSSSSAALPVRNLET